VATAGRVFSYRVIPQTGEKLRELITPTAQGSSSFVDAPDQAHPTPTGVDLFKNLGS